MSKRPPRLERIFECYHAPIFFITFNTWRRRPTLTTGDVHDRFIMFSREAEARGIAVGRYVIMPDHLHLFVSGGHEFVLTQWVRVLKRALSQSIVVQRPHWQSGFFDHLIRNSESYSQKWEYVRDNPVRAGLVTNFEAWPYQGEIVVLDS